MQHKTAILGFIQLLSLPIIILNWVGWICSGIWLAFQGNWSAIFWGLGLLLFSDFLIGILMTPSSIFSHIFLIPLITNPENKRKSIIFFAFSLYTTYILFIITVWCIGILYFFIVKFSLPQNSIVPLLVWSYGFATSPWSTMAIKEQQNTKDTSSFSSSIAALAAQLAYIIVMILIASTKIEPLECFITFVAFMFISYILQSVSLYKLGIFDNQNENNNSFA